MLQKPSWPADEFEAFEQFWDEVPRKIAKKAAKLEFERVRKSGEVPFEVLLSAMKAYARACIGKEMRYVVHPRTWLSQGRWDDDPNAWLNIKIGPPCRERIAAPLPPDVPKQRPTENELDKQFARLGLQHLRRKHNG